MPSTARRLPLAIALGAAAAAACATGHAARPAPEPGFDPARARAEVEWLADPARTGRGVGTPGGPAAAAWIADRFAEAGLRPAFDAGYLQTFEVASPSPRPSPPAGAGGEGETLRVGERTLTANVVAVLPGRDPSVAGHCVVVGAHHDHLGYGGEGSLAPGLLGTIHPGANDNASGLAALLAVARAAAAEGPARRTIVFAAFGAEELGRLGSAFLVRHPPPGCPVESMQLMVNLDTVGKPQGGKVFLDGTSSARGLRERIEALAARSPRLPLTLVPGGGQGGSDDGSFLARGVPAVFLFTGADADYHRPSDTPDKLDYGGLAAVARLASRIARDAADGEPLERVQGAAPPAPADHSSPSPPRSEAERGRGSGRGGNDRGYGAYLGAIPDFAERKEPGVLLAGVRPGSPAEQGGMAAGDVLLRVGSTTLRSLQDLAIALRAHRAGDEVEVEWERGGQRTTAKVRLGERK